MGRPKNEERLFENSERKRIFQRVLYYAYFMLFFSPDEKKLTEDISQLMKKLKQGKRVRENIEKYFMDLNDRGPAWIEEITQGSVMQTLVDDVRQDAFERIRNLI